MEVAYQRMANRGHWFVLFVLIRLITYMVATSTEKFRRNPVTEIQCLIAPVINLINSSTELFSVQYWTIFHSIGLCIFWMKLYKLLLLLLLLLLLVLLLLLLLLLMFLLLEEQHGSFVACIFNRELSRGSRHTAIIKCEVPPMTFGCCLTAYFPAIRPTPG